MLLSPLTLICRTGKIFKAHRFFHYLFILNLPTLNPAHQQQQNISLFYSRISPTQTQFTCPQLPSTKGCLRPGLKEALDKGVLLAGPTLCFLLMLFFLPVMVHGTAPSSTPASKSLWSYSFHSPSFLNLKTVFSFLILHINLASV